MNSDSRPSYLSILFIMTLIFTLSILIIGCDGGGGGGSDNDDGDIITISAPTLKSPIDYDSITDTTPTLDWDNVSGAVEFEVVLDDSESLSYPIIAESVNSSSFTIPDNKELSEGTYYWKVQCRDINNNWSEWSQIFSFTIVSDYVDIQPSAFIDSPSGDIAITEGQSLLFQGSISSGNPPFIYEWDFDGGAINSTSKDPGSISFNSVGFYYISFTVTDNDGDTSTDTLVVTVESAIIDTNPTAIVDLPSENTTITEGQSLLFTGSVAAGNAPFTYEWNFDGGATSSAVEDPGNTIFTTAGTFYITFTVTDDDGDTSSDLIIVTVESAYLDIEPVAMIDNPIEDQTITEGQSILFQGSVTSGNEPLTYEWTFDGGATNFFSQDPGSVTFNIVGTFEVIFTVTDSDGDTSSDSVTIIVENEPIGNVAGTVYLIGTTDPISGVVVTIGTDTDTSDSNGEYLLTNLPIGAATIAAQKSDYESYSTTIEIGTGDNIYDIFMTSSTQTASVDGTVTSNCDDEPVSGAIVKIGGLQDTTDSTGHYQLPTVPQGDINIIVTHSNHFDFNGTFYLYSADKTFNIELTENISPEITITPTPGSILVEDYSVTIEAIDNCDPAPKIYYTIDGSNPTINSNLYDNPITFSPDPERDVEIRYFTVDITGNMQSIQSSTYEVTRLVKRCPINGRFASGIAFDGSTLWYSDYTLQDPNELLSDTNPVLYRINGLDPSTCQPTQRYIIGTKYPSSSSGVLHTFSGLAYDYDTGYLICNSPWVTTYDPYSIFFNPETGSFVGSKIEHWYGNRVAFDGTFYWSSFRNTFNATDSSFSVVNTITLGSKIRSDNGLAFDGKYLWCAYYDRDYGGVHQIDTSTGTVVDTIDYFSTGSSDITIEGNYIWTTSMGYINKFYIGDKKD